MADPRWREGTASQPIDKKTRAYVAISTAVLVRIGDVVTDVLVWRRWYIDNKDDDVHLDWMLIQGIIIILSCLVSAGVSYIRQKHYERNHDAVWSGVLGALNLQLIVELFDTFISGHKSACLKLLLNYGAVVQSVPSAFLQGYIGFRHNQWTPLLVCSFFFSTSHVILSLIGAEKEQFIARGLGKLPLCSMYSVVLFFFRSVEVPARIFVITLFAAEFGWWLFLMLGLDWLVLVMIRHSTYRRMLHKKEQAKKALRRSLTLLNKDVEDIPELEDILQDDHTGVFDMDLTALTLHVILWSMVYLDGVDGVPYLALRLVEHTAAAALFVIFESIDGWQYQQWMLILAAVFIVLHLMFAPAWVYFRSHAEFLHPDLESAESMQQKLVKLLAQIPDKQAERQAAAESSDDGDLDGDDDGDGDEGIDSDVELPRLKPRSAAPATRDPPSDSESDTAPKQQKTTDVGHFTEVVVKEVPVTVAAPPGEKRTQGAQYDWQDFAPADTIDIVDATNEDTAPPPSRANEPKRACEVDECNVM